MTTKHKKQNINNNIYNDRFSLCRLTPSERPSRLRFGTKPPKTLPPLGTTTTMTATAIAAQQQTIKSPKTKAERRKEENERVRLLMMKIKNLRDLIEDQKEAEATLLKEIDEMQVDKTTNEDKVSCGKRISDKTTRWVFEAH